MTSEAQTLFHLAKAPAQHLVHISYRRQCPGRLALGRLHWHVNLYAVSCGAEKEAVLRARSVK